MIDIASLRHEVAQARAARRQAEEARCDVEELLWEVKRGPRTWRRLAQVDAPEPVTPTTGAGMPATLLLAA